MENLNSYVNELVWQLEQQRQVAKAERQRLLAESKLARREERKSLKRNEPAKNEPVVVKEKLGWN